jgi:hypothetical protein
MVPPGAMRSETVSDGKILNSQLNSLSVLNPVEGGVSVEKSVAFSSFGLSGCSIWVIMGVMEVGEVTEGVGNEKMVRFCENLLVMACVVLIFVFFAFFLFPGSYGHCDMATQVGGLVLRSWVVVVSVWMPIVVVETEGVTGDNDDDLMMWQLV